MPRNLKTYPTLNADVLVIGSGAAGMATALALAPLNVLLVTKTEGLVGGSTAHAQGGIATVFAKGDTPALHADDTHFAGAGLTNKAAVNHLTTEGAKVVEQLLALGMPFDRDAEGNISVGLEAAHSMARIVHAGGDATGWHLSQTLAAAVAKARHIQVVANTHVAELVKKNGKLVGAWGFSTTEGWLKLQAANVMLATGGAGQMFSHTTNPAASTGDGIALAYEAGATLADLEFVQFHPTSLAVKTPDGKQPLLTEALRGSGGKLVNKNGERFMLNLHKDAELAPRDVVARGVWAELAADRTPYLDVRHIANVEAKFPNVTRLCAEYGLNPATDLLPVAPAAHYYMGGVRTDLAGKTDVPGLWAVGEVAVTGVHGANRLASNSLLECLVFAKSAAADIKQLEKQDVKISTTPPRLTLAKHAAATKQNLRDTMYKSAGLVREKQGLENGLQKLATLQNLPTLIATGDDIPQAIELRNLMTLAPLVLTAALARTESRGGHMRSDYPTTQNTHKKSILINKLQSTSKVEKEGIYRNETAA